MALSRWCLVRSCSSVVVCVQPVAADCTFLQFSRTWSDSTVMQRCCWGGFHVCCERSWLSKTPWPGDFLHRASYSWNNFQEIVAQWYCYNGTVAKFSYWVIIRIIAKEKEEVLQSFIFRWKIILADLWKLNKTHRKLLLVVHFVLFCTSLMITNVHIHENNLLSVETTSAVTIWDFSQTIDFDSILNEKSRFRFYSIFSPCLL